MNIIVVALVKAVVFSGSIVTVFIISAIYGNDSLGYFTVAASASLLTSILHRGGAPILLLSRGVDASGGTSFRYFLATMLGTKALALTTLIGFIMLLILSWLAGQIAALTFMCLLPMAILNGVFQLISSHQKLQQKFRLAALFDQGLIILSLGVMLFVFHVLGVSDSFASGMHLVGGSHLILVLLLLICAHKINLRAKHKIKFTTWSIGVTLNSVLMFMLRNGYPLLFAPFVSIVDIGQFRLEERLAFAVTFVYLIFETFMAARIVRRLGQITTLSQRWALYRQVALPLLCIAVLSSLTMAALTQSSTVMELTGNSAFASSSILLYVAVPFYIINQLNVFLLNMIGCYQHVTLSIALGTLIFIVISFIFYAGLGLDALRIGYLAAGVVSCLGSSFLLARAFRIVPSGLAMTKVSP